MANDTERPRPAIIIPADSTRDEINRLHVLHALGALSEGMCPSCAGDLRQATEDPGRGSSWLYCRNCPCFWQADHTEQRVTWEAWWTWEGVDPSPNVNEDPRRLGLL